jgi:hypothetical protein
MPIVSRKGLLFQLGQVGSLPEEPEEPGFFADIVPAAFRLGFVGSLVNAPYETPLAERDPAHDPFEKLAGTHYAEYARAFIYSGSEEETTAIMRSIDEQNKARRILAAGGWRGVVADLASGLLDPINLVPVGAAVGAARAGRSVLQGGARTALAGVLGSSASEMALHSVQETRTLGESAANVAASALLSGVLGASASALSRRQYAALAKSVEADMDLAPIVGGSGVDPDKIPLDVEEIVAFHGTGTDFGKPVVAGGAGAEVAPPPLRPSPEESVPDGIAGEKLVGAFGVEKATALLRANPGVRIDVQSPSIEARKMRQLLTETPYLLVKNLSDEENPISVEAARLGWYKAAEADFYEGNDFEYVNYRRRLLGQPPLSKDRFLGSIANRIDAARLYLSDKSGAGKSVNVFDTSARRVFDADKLRPYSRKEFMEEIGWAAANGDAHPVPEIQSRAKALRQTLDEVKARAAAVERMDADITPESAPSFFPRMYRNALLERDDEFNRFREVIARNFKRIDPDLTDEEAFEIGTQVRRTILGTPAGRIPKAAEFGGGRSMKKRPLGFIPDSELAPWLEKDAELVLSHYLRSMSADIELTKAFGTVDFETAFKPTLAEYEAKILAAAPEARARIEADLKADQRDLRAMWELTDGSFVTSRYFAPDQLPIRVLRSTRQATYLALGGGFLVNSLPDPGVLVMHNGLGRTLRHGVLPFIANTKATKLTKKELRLAGAAREVTLGTRALSMADVGDDARPRTRFERGLTALAHNFPLLTLHSPWNSAWKQMSGLINHWLILEAGDDLLSGRKVAKRDLASLARYGLNESHLRRIGEQLREFGEKEGGVWISNTDAWTDIEIRDRFRDVLRIIVDAQIATPGLGDKPPLMSTELGKSIGQFRSFGFATIPRTVIPGLQQHDLATFNGMALMLALGMGVYAIKELQAGRELSDDPRQWIKEGVDRSGLLGFYADVNNAVEITTRRQLGFSALVGGPTVSRYSQRNDLENLLGPSARLVGNVMSVTGAASAGVVSQAETRTVRRMFPYQNVWYLSWLFDHVEAGANESLGLPAPGRKQVRPVRRTP